MTGIPRHVGHRRRAIFARERLPETTYVELVQSLFGLVMPAVIMTICFACVGAYAVATIRDPLLDGCYAAGLIASAIRLTFLFSHRREARSARLDAEQARRIERRFGLAYIGFALALGAFAARGYAITDADIHMLLVALVFGYGAGVAATVSLRPWLSITAILAGVVPMILVGAFRAEPAYWGTALLTALFLAGGIASMLRRYRDTAAQISLRRLMEKLAREDDLTGLPNRLVLRERFEAMAAGADTHSLVALHCVDINQLEPVNDIYGHTAGDALLRAVAQRLRRVVRGENLVIHLNGDDFVIVQPNIRSLAEAEVLAHQVVATLDKSYVVANEHIIITANVGYAVDLQNGADLEQLLIGAERALSAGKRGASGVASYGRQGWAAAESIS